MSGSSQSENAYLEIGFRSAFSEGTLQTIEIIGVLGKKLPNGEYAVSDEDKHFFDDLIVRNLFRKSRSLHECDFRFLKVWLHNTEIDNQERGYKIPTIDRRDLCIRSQNFSSKLKTIYILDNELEGEEYQRWERICQELFSCLFDKFIAPPEPPSIIKDNPLIGNILSMIESVDRYGKDKQKLSFDALIIQID